MGKLSLPTRKTQESEALESNLAEMRQKSFQSFALLPIKFGCGNQNDDFQVRDERRCVEFVRMNRLERMSRELLEEGTRGDLPVNHQANIYQVNENIASENSNIMSRFEEQLIKDLEKSQLDFNKEIQAMKNQLQTVQLDMHYLALSKMQKNIDSTVIGEQEMKELAVILNRVTGIILTIVNVGLIIYTGMTMFSSEN